MAAKRSFEELATALGEVPSDEAVEQQAPAAKRQCVDLDEDGAIKVPQQYVGWLKGAKGMQIKDMEARSGSRIEIDQSTKDLGYSKVLLIGADAAKQVAFQLVSEELIRVMERDGMSEQSPSAPGETVEEIEIPQKSVGWLKGTNGRQLQDLEARTGARIRIDQTSRERGFSLVQVTGTPEAIQTCRAFIESEVARVEERDRVVGPGGGSTECTQEVRIPQPYVGWIKGARGAQLKDLEQRTGVHINIDQSTQALGYSRALLYGPREAVNAAADHLERELAIAKQRDESGGALSAPSSASPTAGNGQQADAVSLIASLIGAIAQVSGAGGASGTVANNEPVDKVQIPLSCVGWLKGKQGAMIREIQARSGAVVDIDQESRENQPGLSTAIIRGTAEQRKIASGLIVAEVLKVADNAGEVEQYVSLGRKAEFQIESQYIGWIKGPKGKVVQDIQVRSGTRIDIDQTTRDAGFAMLKVYGTHDGVEAAINLIGLELSKISPEVAAQFGCTASPLAATPGPAPSQRIVPGPPPPPPLTIAAPPSNQMSVAAAAAAAAAAAGVSSAPPPPPPQQSLVAPSGMGCSGSGLDALAALAPLLQQAIPQQLQQPSLQPLALPPQAPLRAAPPPPRQRAYFGISSRHATTAQAPPAPRIDSDAAAQLAAAIEQLTSVLKGRR